jgi:hypothetical protein
MAKGKGKTQDSEKLQDLLKLQAPPSRQRYSAEPSPNNVVRSRRREGRFTSALWRIAVNVVGLKIAQEPIIISLSCTD